MTNGCWPKSIDVLEEKLGSPRHTGNVDPKSVDTAFHCTSRTTTESTCTVFYSCITSLWMKREDVNE